MTARGNSGGTNITNILANAPDASALEAGEVVEIDLRAVIDDDGTVSVSKEVSKGMPLEEMVALLVQAEDMVDKRKPKDDEIIGAGYVNNEGEVLEVSIKDRFLKPSLRE